MSVTCCSLSWNGVPGRDGALLPVARRCRRPESRDILKPIWRGVPELPDMTTLGGAFRMRRHATVAGTSDRR